MVELAPSHVRMSYVVEGLHGRVEPLGERPHSPQDAGFVPGFGPE